MTVLLPCVRHLALCGLLLLATPAHAWRLEAGEATAQSTFTTPAAFTRVNFQHPFDVIPVVITVATDEGSDPATVRIRNVTTTGFDIAPTEPQGNDGPHVAMTVHYVAIEPGNHRLPTGELLVAATHATTAYQGKRLTGTSWDSVSFPTSPGSTPAVLATIQTMASETQAPGSPSSPWLTPAIRNVTAAGMQMSLDYSETSSGTVSTETVGYVAVQSGGAGVFTDNAGNSISWSALRTADAIVGWGNGCTTYTFSSAAYAAPRIVATKNRRDGGDGGWLRRCSLSNTQIGLVVDEDEALDTERNHTTENAGILAFSRSFHANFGGEVSLNKAVTATTDPTGGDLSIPGATTRYTVTFSNTGSVPIDPDTVIIIDAIHAETQLRVADIGASGSGPVTFTDGTPASGLTYTYFSLASTTDDLAFSNDGGLTYTYTPSAGTDGTDPAVTHIRVTPKGMFGTGSPSPNAQIEFEVVIR